MANQGVQSGAKGRDNTSFDGMRRRRILLVRHGEVRYVDESGAVIPDPTQVPLTERGQQQARELGERLRGHSWDLRLSSPLRRSYDTLRLASGGDSAAPPIEVEPDLEEIRLPRRDRLQVASLQEFAYPFLARNPDGTETGAYAESFWGGERVLDLQGRVLAVLNRLLARDGWHSALIAAHGGVNSVVLCWALEAPLRLAAHLDQEFCCLNIIDVDLDQRGRVARKLVRAMNSTAETEGAPATHTQWEHIAQSLRDRLDGEGAAE